MFAATQHQVFARNLLPRTLVIVAPDDGAFGTCLRRHRPFALSPRLVNGVDYHHIHRAYLRDTMAWPIPALLDAADNLPGDHRNAGLGDSQALLAGRTPSHNKAGRPRCHPWRVGAAIGASDLRRRRYF